ncbi:MAG: hypothetical protein FWD17_10635 [Polyangiaceae bacterium]|nr:hypothetical protein [Polyangiaceae bacterium]
MRPTLVACSIVSGIVASACSSKNATPQAFVEAQLASGAANGQCNFGNEVVLTIGDVDAKTNDVKRVSDGSGPTTVSCTVKSTGNGNFSISGEVADNATGLGRGGSLVISGTVNDSNGGQNISVRLTEQGTTYAEEDCSIMFPSSSIFAISMALTPAPPNVATGRIFGELSCPNASTIGGSPAVCIATMDFVFENCSQ